MILKYEDGDDFYLNYEVPKVPLGGSPKETLDAIALEKDLQEIPVVDITGFNTHEEFIAYQQGRSDEEEITEKFIANWDGSRNSRFGELMYLKIQEFKDKI